MKTTHPIFVQTPAAVPLLLHSPSQVRRPRIRLRLPALYARRPPRQGFTGTGTGTGADSKTRSEEGDEKIADSVWRRMIKRILVSVGVPLGTGLALLHLLDLLKQQGFWDFPLWVPFVATFLTFGASALGIAYGSLSTSLDAEDSGSLLGMEQLEKNWAEMWNDENNA